MKEDSERSESNHHEDIRPTALVIPSAPDTPAAPLPLHQPGQPIPSRCYSPNCSCHDEGVDCGDCVCCVSKRWT
jgi:hypothetical protein